MIYRLISKNDWQTARVSGRVDATPSDIDSGFMHFSPKEEVLETALRYFSPELCPVVLEVDEVALGPKLQSKQSQRGTILTFLISTKTVLQSKL